MSTRKPAPKRKAASKPAAKPRVVYKVSAAPAKTQVRRAPAAKKADPTPSSVGGDLGQWIGSKLGGLVEKLTGFGDYQVVHNSLLENVGGIDPPPMVNSTDKGGYIVRHREFITDIAGTTAFTNQSFAINPGLGSTFPWLANIAGSFEEYAIRGMVFEFKSLSSDSVLSSATNSALGAVVMATEYNVLNPSFTTKSAMENYDFANSAKPSVSFIHPVECKRRLTPLGELFVRSSPNTSNLVGDQRMYDLGNFQIATVGQQANGGVLGELWCSYEIEFFKAKTSSFVLTDHYRLATISDSAPLGTTSGSNTVAAGQTNNIGGVLNGAGTAYSFPNSIASGRFLVVLTITGTGRATTAPTITFTNAAGYGGFTGGGAASFATTGSGVSTLTMVFTMNISASGAAFTLSGAVLPASPTSGDLWVTAISTNVL